MSIVLPGRCRNDDFQPIFQTLCGILSADDAFRRRIKKRAGTGILRVFHYVDQCFIQQRESLLLQNRETADFESCSARQKFSAGRDPHQMPESGTRQRDGSGHLDRAGAGHSRGEVAISA